MTVREVLLLGNPMLYEISKPIQRHELDQVAKVVTDLHDTLMHFKKRYKVGRAIAAPQIGVMKRLVYLCVDTPMILINPTLDQKSEEMMELWDDCMSFPDLLVKVRRHSGCRITYYTMDWDEEELRGKGDLSELLQHEYDHLDGILAVMRAIDNRSFALRSQKGSLD